MTPAPGRFLRALPALAATGCWLTLLAVAAGDPARSWARAWVSWLLDPMFHDWEVVRWGWQVRGAGVDALADPNHPFNYPRLVLVPADWGAGSLPAAAGGLALAALMLGAFACILRARSVLESVAGAGLLVSLPVALAMERGNLDQLVLALVAGGLALLAPENSGPVRRSLGFVLLMLAAAIKLFPVAVLAGLVLAWRDRRRRWALAALGLVLVWFGLNLEEIALILRKTTRGLEPAYGRLILAARYQHDFGDLPWSARWTGIGGLAACGAVLATAVVAGWRARGAVGAGVIGAYERLLLVAGALIYVGTYLLGSNWSYRLVFLLLCVPGLWTLARTRGCRPWAAGALGLIHLSCWVPVHLAFPWFALVQLGQLGLAGLLAGFAAMVLATPSANLPAEPGSAPAPTRG